MSTRLQGQVQERKTTPIREAVTSSQANGAVSVSLDSNQNAEAGNEQNWEASELDDLRFGLSKPMLLGEISSEEKPGPVGGALLSFSRGILQLPRVPEDEPARPLPRFATIAPIDREAPTTVKTDEAGNLPGSGRRKGIEKFRDRKRAAAQRRRRIEKMLRSHRRCTDCGKRMSLDGIFPDRPELVTREGVEVLVCRVCDARAVATEGQGAA